MKNFVSTRIHYKPQIAGITFNLTAQVFQYFQFIWVDPLILSVKLKLQKKELIKDWAMLFYRRQLQN